MTYSHTEGNESINHHLSSHPGIFGFLSLHTLSLYRIRRCRLPTNQTDTPNYLFG